MVKNKKIAELFRKKSLFERKRTEYSDWTYWLHIYVPWFFLCFLSLIQGTLGWDAETFRWTLVFSIHIFFILSYLWWRKIQRYSKRIAKIDEKIAEEFETSF